MKKKKNINKETKKITMNNELFKSQLEDNESFKSQLEALMDPTKDWGNIFPNEDTWTLEDYNMLFNYIYRKWLVQADMDSDHYPGFVLNPAL